MRSKSNSTYSRESYYRHHEANLKRRREYRNKPEVKAKAKIYAKKYREKVGDRLRENSKKWYYKNNIRLRRYNLTLEDFEKLVLKHKGRCAICNQKKELVIDHCHNSNAVRGLLCHSCNKGLGCFYDNPNLLEKAKNYVTQVSRSNS